MVVNAWIFDEQGEMHDRLIDVEDLNLFGIIKEDDDESTGHQETDRQI